MAEAKASLDISSMEQIADKMERYGPKATEIVQDYLKTDAWSRITAGIPGLIHASGRTWKNKKASATTAGASSVFRPAELSELTLTVRTQTRYNYLYFPDDGSNTKRHIGNQQFMRRGAENQSAAIATEIIARLTAAFEEA